MASAAALPAVVDRGAQRHALRIAFGVTACFTIVEALDWDFTFVAPMLAAQLLIGRQPPRIAQSLVLLLAIGLAAAITLIISAAFVETPATLILVLSLLLYLSFYAHLRGRPPIVTLMFQLCAVSIPVFAVISPSLSVGLAAMLFGSGVVASLMAWAAHAAFPDFDDSPAPTGKSAGSSSLPASVAARYALHDTLILMPVLIWYLVANRTAVVFLIVVVTVIRLHGPHGPGQGKQAAIALILGNLIGGLGAGLAYVLVQANGAIVFFAIVCLAASLMFAGRIVTAGARAPVYVTAFASFLIVLGIGITPLPGGSGEAFVSRILNVLLATAYAVGALSLLSGSQDRTA
jgi:uncharacterized membrane protein YccC